MPIHEAAKRLNESCDTWKSNFHDIKNCPVRNVMDHFGDRWSVLVIISLASRPYRFGELRRHITDISQRMLTQTLRDLRRDGLVNRTVYPTLPPSVEYSLTALGETLLIPLWKLVEWAEINHDNIIIAREAFIHSEK